MPRGSIGSTANLAAPRTSRALPFRAGTTCHDCGEVLFVSHHPRPKDLTWRHADCDGLTPPKAHELHCEAVRRLTARGVADPSDSAVMVETELLRQYWVGRCADLADARAEREC